MYRYMVLGIVGLIWCGSITTEGESAPQPSIATLVTPEVPSSTLEHATPVSGNEQLREVFSDTSHNEQAATPQTPPAQEPTPSPAPTQSQETSAQQIADEPQGIDTISLQEGSGNWLYKRIWWEKAEAKYETIKVLVDRILEAQMIFFARRAELARTVFDPFYINAGIGRGELEEILNYLIEQMNAQQQKQGDLNEEERAFLSIMNKEKETLDQLKLDMDAINKLDSAVDESLGKLMEQLNLCRSYERRAWDDFKSIAKELSDKRARELYYSMVTCEENINAIGQYFKHDFTGYFDQLGTLAQENIGRIQSAINALKEKGIDFKKKAQELEKKDEHAERERRIREQEEKEREEQEAAAANTWYGWIMSWFSSAWDAISLLVGGAYSSIRGLFGSSSSEEAEAATEPALSK
ncbi:MAG: hypothetical protein ACHQVS_01570 [Candidatus Babeliales bacterium]